MSITGLSVTRAERMYMDKLAGIKMHSGRSIAQKGNTHRRNGHDWPQDGFYSTFDVTLGGSVTQKGQVSAGSHGTPSILATANFVVLEWDGER